MKFTHRSAGARKGTGASQVNDVKKEPQPKRSILCKKCGEHPSKCGCDKQKSFAKLGDLF